MDIPEEVFLGTTAGVFDFIAGVVADFAKAEGLVPEGGAPDPATLPPIGFCFSFPMSQHAVDR